MKEREGDVGIEGDQGEKLNFEVCLTCFSFIKIMASVTHVSIYSLAQGKLPNFLEKQGRQLPWEARVRKLHSEARGGYSHPSNS